MTDKLVIDASAFIAYLRREPEAESVAEVLRDHGRRGGSFLVPAGFWLEVINSFIRRHRLTSADVLQAFEDIDAFGVDTVATDRPMSLMCLDLAERFGLTAYDAAYLALAIVEEADVLTLDGALAAAAGSRTVQISGQHRLHEAPVPYEHEVTWPRYKEAARYLAKLRADALAG